MSMSNVYVSSQNCGKRFLKTLKILSISYKKRPKSLLIYIKIFPGFPPQNSRVSGTEKWSGIPGIPASRDSRGRTLYETPFLRFFTILRFSIHGIFAYLQESLSFRGFFLTKLDRSFPHLSADPLPHIQRRSKLVFSRMQCIIVPQKFRIPNYENVHLILASVTLEYFVAPQNKYILITVGFVSA